MSNIAIRRRMNVQEGNADGENESKLLWYGHLRWWKYDGLGKYSSGQSWETKTKEKHTVRDLTYSKLEAEEAVNEDDNDDDVYHYEYKYN